MDIAYPGFGSLVVEGKRFDHDVVIAGGEVSARNKKASRPHRAEYGHTPLSVDEGIPWATSRLVIGTGADGRLPIMPEVRERAEALGVELITAPTAEAVELLRPVAASEVYAVLHVTC